MMSVQSKGVRFPILLGSTVVLASCAAMVAGGCSLDSGGLGDLFESVGDGGTNLDATFTQTADGSVNGGGDAGDDDGTISAGDSSNGDSGNDTPDTGTDSCASNVEICNNGIDDNCNGKIDCADPECGSPAWTCTNQTVPQGWTVVEYSNSASPAATCGTGYGSAANVYEGPFANAMCACTCSLTGHGSCESGNFEVSVSDGLGNCTIGVPADPAGNGGCEPINPAYSPGNGAKEKITPASYSGTAATCSGTTVPTIPPIAENGHVCTASAAPGAGCSNNGACVPVATPGYGLCIQHGGAMSCPNGFGNGHTIGTSVTDTRGCTSCNCTGPTGQCTNSTATLFTDPGCSEDGGVVTVAANNQCNNINGTGTYNAYKYTGTPSNEACGGSGSATANGSVSLNTEATICCQ
jgi:hypothetical protein